MCARLHARMRVLVLHEFVVCMRCVCVCVRKRHLLPSLLTLTILMQKSSWMRWTCSRGNQAEQSIWGVTSCFA